MNAPEETERHDGTLPEPHVDPKRSRWLPSLIWIVPLVAAIVGLSLAVHSYFSRGPTIHITFLTAEGLAPSKTEVRYKEVVIGKVSDIRLTEDKARVSVTVELNKSDAQFASADARFWVVRPRVGVGGVSGLGTLLSGAYIGADIGDSREERRDFEGLVKPPAVLHGMQGKRLFLHASDLGSLDIGSPVYFRRIQVGHVSSYELAPDGRSVNLEAFVDAPNDKYVTKDARFWNASGVDLQADAQGFHLTTQSLATVIAGGVAFQPASDADTQSAAENAEFDLHSDMSTAMRPHEGAPVIVRLMFPKSVRGLTPGAPLDFRGITLGEVASVTLTYDPVAHSFPTEVMVNVYPPRLGRVYESMQSSGKTFGDFLQGLVERGFRAQARRGNLLTGQLYISLEKVPSPIAANFDAGATPLDLPTAPDALDDIQTQIQEIVKKINAIPFDQLGAQLQQTLQGANAFLNQLNGKLTPEATGMLKDARKTLDTLDATLSDDSSLQQNTRSTLEEVQRAARSFRALSDYLDRHPESLIRGKGADAPLDTSPQKPGDSP